MTQRWRVRLWQTVSIGLALWCAATWMLGDYGHAGVAFFLTAFALYRLAIARIQKTVINDPTGRTFIWRDGRRTTEHQRHEDE